MTARFKTTLAVVALMAATSVITTRVVSQDGQPGPEMMQEMMQMWAALAEPGPEHARLARFEGTWQQKNSHQMMPGAPAMESSSVAEFTPILDGRFLLERVRGSYNINGVEQAFEGMGIFGYDKLKEKHVFVWLDSMGTMIMNGEGTADATGDVVTYHSEVPDPSTGGMFDFKSVWTRLSDHENVYEMFQKMPDDSWFRNMQVVSSRE